MIVPSESSLWCLKLGIFLFRLCTSLFNVVYILTYSLAVTAGFHRTHFKNGTFHPLFRDINTCALTSRVFCSSRKKLQMIKIYCFRFTNRKTSYSLQYSDGQDLFVFDFLIVTLWRFNCVSSVLQNGVSLYCQ